MRLTNKHGLPDPIVRALSRDSYSKGAADFSVTQLIDSPRAVQLKERNQDKIVRDASELVWSLLGRAVHTILEEAAQADARDRKSGKNRRSIIAEKRFFLDVCGATISGGMDLITSDDRVVITDYKVTSSNNVSEPKIEWERQLNMYAYLYHKTQDERIDGVQVIAIVRDWKRRRAQMQPSYPQSPIIAVPIPRWTPEKQLDYISDRVKKHLRARNALDFGEDLPLCTDEERWMRPPRFAVTTAGRSRAAKVFDSEDEAEADAKKRGAKFYVEQRAGHPIRCAEYCEGAAFCSQWAEEVRAGKWDLDQGGEGGEDA